MFQLVVAPLVDTTQVDGDGLRSFESVNCNDADVAEVDDGLHFDFPLQPASMVGDTTFPCG